MRRGAGVHPWDWTVPSCVQPLALTRSLMRRMRASFPQQVPQYPIVPLKYPHTTHGTPTEPLKYPYSTLQYCRHSCTAPGNTSQYPHSTLTAA